MAPIAPLGNRNWVQHLKKKKKKSLALHWSIKSNIHDPNGLHCIRTKWEAERLSSPKVLKWAVQFKAMCSSSWTCPVPSSNASPSCGRNLKGDSAGGEDGVCENFPLWRAFYFLIIFSWVWQKTLQEHELFMRAGLCLQMSQDDREDINAVNNKVDQGKVTGFRTNIAHGVFRILFPLSSFHMSWRVSVPFSHWDRFWGDHSWNQCMRAAWPLLSQYLFPFFLLAQGIGMVCEFHLGKTNKHIVHMPGIHVI